MERLRIVVNFKNTPEDIELYNKLKKRSSISGYIKDVLKGLEENEVVNEKKEISSGNDNEIADDIADILN
ncbi:hypothetical protein A500_04626 [Clostridium sartagoforme AAU1]|uniref:Uncharacterized protein n=1 Tax=Clostridium sartagoforme AAU1 TaxID=1202534 RepID=R9CDR4_9CLOT|nr:hypothetical protein [Clostridium sartagoforme]EOR27398.1 hypothetical protein A500_04626 [Clostridium sartagoforme AAU1]